VWPGSHAREEISQGKSLPVNMAKISGRRRMSGFIPTLG
jgi:hypothetical protein